MRMMVIMMMSIVFFQSYQQDQRYKRSSVMELNSAGGYYNPEKVNILQWGAFSVCARLREWKYIDNFMFSGGLPAKSRLPEIKPQVRSHL